MTVLEGRYRSVLRLLPASYRAVWEEEMVTTFLHSVHTDDPDDAEYLAYCGRPSRSEVLSIAALAVRLRLGGAEAPPRSFVWGEAVRLVALVGLLTNAVTAIMGVLQALWLSGGIPWPPVPGEVLALADSAPSSLVHMVWDLGALVWVAAYLALVFGHRRSAQVLAGLALVPAVVVAISSAVDLAVGRPAMTSLVITLWSRLLVDILLVLALVAFHRDAPPVSRRPWLVALGVGVALVPIPGFVFLWQVVRDVMLLDWPGVLCVALVAAALVHLARAEFSGAPPAWARSLALALLAAAVLGLRVVSLVDYGLSSATWTDGAAMTVGLVEAVAVLAVAVPLTRLAAEGLRRLPPAPSQPKRAVTPAP